MEGATGTWTKGELEKIAETDDLHVSPFRDDGKTYGTPTWIWSVDVDFDPVDGPVNDQNDEAYKTKYKGSPYLPPMIGARARSATVKIAPRQGNGEFIRSE